MSQFDVNSLLDSAIAQAKGTSPTKTSAANTPAEPTAREKLSSIKVRNHDVALLGEALIALGDEGFQKVAMQPAGGGAPEAPAVQGDQPVHDASKITAELKSKGHSDTSTSTQPAISEISRGSGEPGADLTTRPASPGSVGTGQGDGIQPGTGAAGDNKDLSTPPPMPPEVKLSGVKASSALQTAVGGKNINGGSEVAAKILARYDIRDATEAYGVFAKTAAARGLNYTDYINALGLDSVSARDELRTIALSMSKLSEGKLDRQVAEAKGAIEMSVKTTGTMPTADDVSRAAQVDPMAANIALYDTAELIAAAGGSVGSAAAPVAAGAQAPGMGDAMGAADPAAAMGGMAAAPAAPAPAADPAAAAAPAAGGMPAGPPKMAGDRAEMLRQFISKQSETNPVQTIAESAPVPDGPKDLAVEPGTRNPVPRSATYEMSATERRIAGALNTNAKATDAEATLNAAQAEKQKDTQPLTNTNVSPGGDKGLFTDPGAQKSTMEGTPEESSPDDKKYDSTGKASGAGLSLAERVLRAAQEATMKRSSGMPEGLKGYDRSKKDGDDSEGESEEDKDDKKKDGDDSGTKESTVVATGLGTSELSGHGGTFTGKSDNVSSRVRPALNYVTEYAQKHSKMPSVKEVMSSNGVKMDIAKEALALAANTGQ